MEINLEQELKIRGYSNRTVKSYLYYILRSGIKLKILADKAKEIKSVIEKETGRFAELKELLPQNFWSILKDLKNNILLELQKQHF